MEVQNANYNLLADLPVISDKRKNNVSPLLNLQVLSDVRQIAIQAAGSSGSEPTSTEAEPDIQMLKSHNSTGPD